MNEVILFRKFGPNGQRLLLLLTFIKIIISKSLVHNNSGVMVHIRDPSVIFHAVAAVSCLLSVSFFYNSHL